MRTDVITIFGTGDGISEALAETEKAAVYCGLEPKQALRLRLLAEEMTGMLRTIVTGGDYRYWIESKGKMFSLHLATDVRVGKEAYNELVKSSSSGKNDAAKGFMGRIRDVVLKLRDSSGAILPTEYGYAYVEAGGCDPEMIYTSAAMFEGWSMKAYREKVEAHKQESPEEWDELERSIMANLADEVKVFIRGNSVELEVDKNF
ncbi:MAG: hypothetical protein II155_03885 [Clostridia bacterium]|nr:hypothetical protein [Clostridia bacterium]